ncbi:hypothetical protein RDABS01_024097, partial [Bienertia sinuspersici]
MLSIGHILYFSTIEVTSQQVLSLMKPFNYVQRLTLMDRFMQVLSVDEFKDHLPMFPNLNHLTLGYYDVMCWDKLLIRFLNSSPILETLGKPSNFELEFYRASYAIPSCCKYHLKRVVIKQYYGVDKELGMIEFLLRHALVLEELVFLKPAYYLSNSRSNVSHELIDEFTKSI